MSIETLVAQYGLPAVFIGTFLEGESVIIAAGLLALSGHMGYPDTAVAAVSGAVAGDMAFFLMGQRSDSLPWSRCHWWRGGLHRAGRLLKRHERLTLVGYRFLYGLRGVVPFVLGAGGFSWRRFMAYSSIGAAVWTGANLFAVYGLGRFMRVHDQPGALFRSISLAVVLVAGVGILRGFRHKSPGTITRDGGHPSDGASSRPSPGPM
ncbi:MAG: VTT domain-containing protein [Desulfobacterales bacterium]|jgi:membrane protein DedA with SNARE-associated domain